MGSFGIGHEQSLELILKLRDILQRGHNIIFECRYLRLRFHRGDGRRGAGARQTHCAALLRDRFANRVFLNGDVAPGGDQIPIRVFDLRDGIGCVDQCLRRVGIHNRP